MKTKHLLTATFSMGLIVLISNTGLAFAVMHTPQYNAGYTASCNDAKHFNIWDGEGSIWYRFYQKYPSSLTKNHEWMQDYMDCTIYID